MKAYKSFEEIDYDLKRLSLERQIAWEQLKGVKGALKEDMKPFHWVETVLGFASKFGFFYILKRLVGRK